MLVPQVPRIAGEFFRDANGRRAYAAMQGGAIIQHGKRLARRASLATPSFLFFIWLSVAGPSVVAEYDGAMHCVVGRLGLVGPKSLSCCRSRSLEDGFDHVRLFPPATLE